MINPVTFRIVISMLRKASTREKSILFFHEEQQKSPWPGGQGAKHSNVKRPNNSLSSQKKQLLNHCFSIIM